MNIFSIDSYLKIIEEIYVQAIIYLIIAIIAEVIGTSFLKLTQGFTVLKPSLVVVVSYATTFYFLSLAVKTIPIGIAYAVWAGLGIVLIGLIGIFYYKESLNLYQIIGTIFIIFGVVLVQLFSKGH